MFFKTLVVAAFVAGALAAPSRYVFLHRDFFLFSVNTYHSSGQCSTSDQLCCNSVQGSNNPQIAKIVASLGIPIDADVPIGLTCTPISVIAAAGNKW